MAPPYKNREVMKEQLIKLSYRKGFKSVDTQCFVSEHYLWLCELHKWLRDKHDIHVCVESGYDVMLKYNRGYGLTLNGKGIWHENDVFEAYQSALETGLLEALKLIK